MKSLRISSVELTIADQGEVFKKIFEFLSTPVTKFVVTPNAGQLRSYRNNQSLREFLRAADLKLIDGWPLAVAASIVEGRKISRVTGSDLLPEIFKNLTHDTRVGIIGGSDANLITNSLNAKYPNLNLVLVNDAIWQASEQAAENIEKLCVDNNLAILILALGHPKQEILAKYLSQKNISSLSLVLCFGASVDFIVGLQKRAPKFIQKIGLEWFYRLVLNPKRFMNRYIAALWPAIVLIISAIRLRFFRFR